jgi:hypothetical protein
MEENWMDGCHFNSFTFLPDPIQALRIQSLISRVLRLNPSPLKRQLKRS